METPQAIRNLRVVLVGTLYGGNIGSVCRAMANCGVSDLRLVAPSSIVDWDEARKMAVHATNLLDGRRTFGDLASATADCVAVVGTTRREGLYRAHTKDARMAAPELLQLAANGPVALVFGREDKGLTNDELLLCTHIVTLAAADDYQSFNLSQAVVLLCHELFRSSIGFVPTREKSPLASSAMRQRMMEHWRNYLLHIKFMNEEKADHMMEGFERIFSRGAMTEADMKILLGVIRQSEWALSNPNRLPDAATPPQPEEQSE